jgi:hypothetical protein
MAFIRALDLFGLTLLEVLEILSLLNAWRHCEDHGFWDLRIH